jgi:hypothetical protein
MWQRRSFHECATELIAISEDFRSAHTNRFGWDRPRRERIMLETSQRGVEVLRILALSIRSDEDFGLTDSGSTPVGALKSKATRGEVLAAIRDYRPPHDKLSGYTPMGLRQALNKVAHADPVRSGFYADNETHDLILSGGYQGDTWIAVISLIDLCRVIQSIPDVRTKQAT